jgi:hypothetical protein
MKNKILLIDPSLNHKDGHHFDLSINLCKSLIKKGYTVNILTNVDIDLDAKSSLEKFAKVTPLFCINHYTALKRTKIPFIRKLINFIKLSKKISRVLKKVPDTDLIIWHTFFPSELYACALSNIKKPIAACLHYEPGSLLDRIIWRIAFYKANKAKLFLNIGGFDDSYIKKYKSLTRINKFNIFPLPFNGKILKRKKKKISTIGFFGNQRLDKGADIILKLIKELILKNFKIILQDTISDIKFFHPKVKNINFVEDLSIEMQKCDLIIMPFHQESYSARCSGTFIYAMSSGIPAIVPKNTTMSHFIKFSGCGIIYEHHTIESIIDALKIAENEYSEISKKSYLVSKNWLNKHGNKKFLESLLNNKNFTKL